MGRPEGDVGGLRPELVKRPVPTATEASGPPPSTTGRPFTPYDVFTLCIQRAKNLLKLHKVAHGRAAKPERYMADAHRAAIVLSVSALDAFVRTFAIENIRVVLADKGRPLPGPLRDQIKKFLKDDDLLEAARGADLLDRVEKAFRADFERRSFQGTRNIEECLRLIGQRNIFHDVAVNAGMNEDTLRRDLDRFTDRRHEIAHRGDYDLSQNPPVEVPVTKKQAETCIRLVTKVAKHIHDLGAS